MLPVFPSSSCRALFRGVSASLVGALALSGCTSAPKQAAPTGPPVPTTNTSTVAPPTKPVVVPPPVFTATAMPAALAAVIKQVYRGGSVRSSPSAGAALRKRKLVKASQPVVVKGAVGTWKGVPIAVVTRGKDVTLAVAAPTWRVVGGWWPSVGVSAPSLGGGPRRVLLIGSDARPSEAVEGARADSLHIVGFDGRGRGGVLGIARDAYVPLSTGGQGKINSALTSGPKALQRTVVGATGVPLDGYLITGFLGFKQLINGIGGLRLNAPVAVRDTKSSANVKAGPNLLSGVQALSYGRARYAVPGGDFGRSANQGLLIMAVTGFARNAGPTKLPGILRTASPRIGTNMSAEQVLTFAAGAFVTPLRNVNNRVAAGSVGFTSGGESIVQFDAKARRLFADIRNGSLS